MNYPQTAQPGTVVAVDITVDVGSFLRCARLEGIVNGIYHNIGEDCFTGTRTFQFRFLMPNTDAKVTILLYDTTTGIVRADSYSFTVYAGVACPTPSVDFTVV